MLNNRNQLNATGMAMSLLGQGLLTKMVKVDVSPAGRSMVFGYATADRKQRLRLYLVNRDTRQQDLILELRKSESKAQGSSRIFSGTGPTDLHPTIKTGPSTSIGHGEGNVHLEPVSTTELTF